MASKLFYIPEESLDGVINDHLDEADNVIISVSFIFLSGLKLIFEKLRNNSNPATLTIITSNYLKSTEPSALDMLLELRNMGARVYLYDSLESNQSFHMKSYFFQVGTLKH